MKTFKKILSEVAQPKSAEEKRFKDQHTIELIKHPVALDSQFTGEIEGLTKKKNPADYAPGQDETEYDKAYAVKNKPFKMPRNIDEEVEELEEGRNEVLKALASLAKQPGMDKKDYQKAHDLYKAAKYDDLKKHIYFLDTEPSEEIAHAISQHDSKTFNSMYPRAKSGDYIRRIVLAHPVKEEAELDEISKKTLGSYVKKSGASMASHGVAVGSGRNTDKSSRAMANRMKGMNRAADRLTREEVEELDEISPKLARKAAAASAAKSFEYGNYAYDDESQKNADRLDKKSDKAYDYIQKRQGKKGVDKTNRLAGKLIYGKSRAFESVEELDEKAVSQAQQKLMGMALAYKRGEMDDASDEVKNLAKSMSMKDLEDFAGTKHDDLPKKVKKEGITFKGLMDKLVTEDVNLNENPDEEIPMMMRQLHFIGYAADEILEYLAIDGLDPEEWWQNKLAYAFAQMKSLHAYVEGDKRVMGYDDEDDLMAAYESVEEELFDDEELDEITEAMLDVKAGMLKLKDNKTVKLSTQEAKMINDMFKGLNPKNKKEMHAILTKDQKGFNEILSFAKEAM